MSEINGPKFGVNPVNYSNLPKQEQEKQSEFSEQDTPQINDFGDPKAEALGRSMLIKDADNINHDLKTLIENPQVADNSDELFETVYAEAQKQGLKNPYEEASTFSTGNV